jgi:arylsulfatase
VKGRPFTVEAVFAAEGDGVVVAQGGVGAGYTLYLKDGKLNFATKHDNKGTHIVTNEKIPAGKVTAQVSLAKDGTIVITVNGKEAARGKTRGPLLMTPIDGLQVGSDPNSPVYNYKAPFPLQGKVESVHIELD